VRQTGGPGAPVEITYLRVLPGKSSRFGWRPSPTNSVVVLIPEAASAPNLAEGLRLAKETLARLSSGELVPEEAPYVQQPDPENVGELTHGQKLLVAYILRWPEYYEVRTVGYVPNGFTLPVKTPSISFDPDCEWGRLDLFERILADTEEEARQAAAEELDRLTASDLPIRLHPI